jgi:hypothetical protein
MANSLRFCLGKLGAKDDAQRQKLEEYLSHPSVLGDDYLNHPDKAAVVLEKHIAELERTRADVIRQIEEHLGVQTAEAPEAKLGKYEKAAGADPITEEARDALIEEVAKVSSNKNERASLAAPTQTETPEFKSWFGDSKVVDENGNPLAVYHGTKADITEFSIDEARGERGIFFTDDASQAASFASRAKKLSASGSNVIKVYLSLQNPLVIDASERDIGYSFDKLIAQARNEKRDGLVVKNADDSAYPQPFRAYNNVYIAFKSEQIKSAIGNRGTFDPTNPDIRSSLSDAAIDRLLNDVRDGTKLPPQRARGAEAIKLLVRRAVKNGSVPPMLANFTEWVIQQNPKLLDNLTLELAPSKEGESRSGKYNMLQRVATLFRGRAVDTTAVHELLHHMERMMPEDVQAAIRDEWRNRITAEISRAEKAGDTKLTAYLNDALLHESAPEMGTANNMVSAITSGDVDLANYQYFDPSEFWAVNMTKLLAKRFIAKDSAWSRAYQWVKEFLQKARSAFKMSSDAPMIRALDDLLERGSGEFKTDTLIDQRTLSADSLAAAKAGSVDDSDSTRKKLFDYLRYKMQDKFNHLKQWQDKAAKEQGLHYLDEELDAKLAELRYAGRQSARMKDFIEDHVDPLIKAMHDGNLEQEHVGKYLHALHAEEANAHLRRIRPTEDELNARIKERELAIKTLSDTEDVRHYRQLAKNVRQAKADLEDMLGDPSAVDAATAEMRKLLKKSASAKEYVAAQEELRGLRATTPFVGDNTQLSGMSDDEAAAIKAKYADNKAMKDVAARAKKIVQMQRDLLVSAGLETAETVAAWEHTYKDYVPLFREGKDDKMPPRGKGFSDAGKTKRRHGSNLDVKDILPHLVAGMESTMIRASKAEVTRRFLNFALASPNPDLYEVDKQEMKAYFDENGLVQFRAVNENAHAPNVLVVKVMGENHTITFNKNSTEAMRMAKSFNNLGTSEMDWVTKGAFILNRVLSSLNTVYNPEFLLSNLPRDLQTAFYNLSSTDADSAKKQIFKDVKKAFQGIRAAQKGELSSEWAKHFREFRDAGGMTGWTEHYADIEARKADLEAKLRELDHTNKAAVLRATKSIKQAVENLNDAVENAIRLSVYVNARKLGLSEARAAAIAKEITVNFNRHGDAGQMLNALYLFYNASVQGTTRMAQAIAKSPKVRKLVYATIATAAVLDIANRLMSGDDDDGEPYYDKLGDLRDRNLIIMLGTGKGDYVKIPLPWGYNVFHVMGQEVGKSLDAMFELSGKASAGPSKSALRIISSSIDAFNPVGGSAGSVLQVISPTAVDPLVQWGENKNWRGEALRPRDNPFDQTKPESQKFWSTNREASKWVAEQLNAATGGSKERSGGFDVSPAAFDLMIDTFTGGAGRFVADSIGTPVKALTGGEVKVRDVPMLRKLYGEPSHQRIPEAFYDHMEQIDTLQNELKAHRGDREKMLSIRKEYAVDYSLLGAAKQYKAQIQSLRERRNAISGSRLPDGEKKLRLKKVNDEIDARMQRFNKLYAERERATAH